MSGGTAAILIAAAIVVLATLVQAMSGFGFALLSAPLLAALLGPVHAISDMALIGLVMHVALLAPRVRAGRFRAPGAGRLVAWALPGVLVGAYVLRVTPAPVLLGAVGVMALAGAVITSRRTAPAVPVPMAGLAFGLLTTSVGTSGPPLVLHLLGRRAGADEFRDTMFVCFLALNPVAIASLVVSGVWSPGPEWPALLPAALVGAAAGSRLRRHVSLEAFGSLALVLLSLAGLTAIAKAVTG